MRSDSTPDSRGLPPEIPRAITAPGDAFALLDDRIHRIDHVLNQASPNGICSGKGTVLHRLDGSCAMPDKHHALEAEKDRPALGVAR